MNGLTVGFDDRSERAIRHSCWRWWTYSISAIAWLLWHESWYNLNGEPMSIQVPILWMFVGYGVGWLFGYKNGIDALFSGVYCFKKNPELPQE